MSKKRTVRVMKGWKNGIGEFSVEERTERGGWRDEKWEQWVFSWRKDREDDEGIEINEINEFLVEEGIEWRWWRDGKINKLNDSFKAVCHRGGD